MCISSSILHDSTSMQRFKGAVRRYCLQREAVQASMISQPVKSLM